MITMKHEAALNAPMLPHGERLADSVATPAAILRSERRIDESNQPSSIFSFGGVDVQERVPCGVRNTFGEMVIFHQPRDVQRFKRKGIELSQQIKRAFVKEIMSLALYLQVLFGKKLDSFPAIVAPKFLPRDGALRGLQPPFSLSQILRILDFRAGRKSGERFYADIHANTLSSFRKVATTVFFDRKDDVPPIGFALDGTCLDVAFNRAREADAATADLGKRQLVALKIETLLRIGEGIIARLGTKARVARFCARLHTAKESDKRFVETAQSVLSNLAINHRNICVHLSHIRQFAALFGVAHRLACYAVGISSVLQSGIVQITADTKRSLKDLSCTFGCPYLVFVRLHRANYTLHEAFSATQLSPLRAMRLISPLINQGALRRLW